jgi:hexosaminidase
VEPGTGAFLLEANADIYLSPATDELRDIGRSLADRLVAATGQPHRVLAQSGPVPSGSISLALTDRHPSLGEEGYSLVVTPAAVQLEAASPQGLFHGVQTLR